MLPFKPSHSLIALMAAVSAYAQDPATVQKKLVAEFAVTQPTADLTDIVTAGSILVLQKNNLMMAPITSSNLFQNIYKDGKIQQNAFGKSKSFLSKVGRVPGVGLIPGTSAAGTADAASGPQPRTYVTGEKMWVTKIEAKSEPKEDSVTFDLYTDAIQDIRYKASLRIAYPKGSSADQVDKLVAEVFKVQPADDAKQAPAGGQQQAAPAAAPAQEANPAIAPPPPPADTAPLPDIPPPPPPTDQPAPPPQTISLGQTPDQVTAILGQPQKIVKLAAKQTYYYKDLKVVFTNGKVSDVQ